MPFPYTFDVTFDIDYFSYTFPLTFPTGYIVEVDWDNDGRFNDIYGGDVTADVTSIHYGRGKSDELGKAEVGQLSITLNNDTGKYTPGAGGTLSALLLPKRPIRLRGTSSSPGEWVSPTSSEDYGVWTTETLAYDGNTGTYASISVAAGAWSDFLELNIAAINANAVKFVIYMVSILTPIVDVDIYYDSDWHHLYEAATNRLEWITVSFDTQSVTKARIRAYNSLGAAKAFSVAEFMFSSLVSNCHNLFYGYIEEIIPHPHLTEQECIITASDGLDFLGRHDMTTALHKNTLTGAIHSHILDDAGWSATRRLLDAGQDTVPYWYGHDVKARFAQEEIDDSEQGFSYIDGAGYFRFEDRLHRSTGAHLVSQGTFTNTMTGISYSMSPKNIYNIIKAKVTPWVLMPITELWRLQEIPCIPVGETYTYWGESQYPVDLWSSSLASLILRPNAAGDETNIPYQYPNSTYHWDKVDEITADYSDTYIDTYSNPNYQRDLFNLPASGHSDEIITSITIYCYIWGGSYPGFPRLKTTQKSGTTITDGAEQIIYEVATWVLKSETFTINPATGSPYTWAEIDALQIGICMANEQNQIFPCTQIYVEVSYNTIVDYTANSAFDSSGTNMTGDIGVTTTKFAKTIKMELKNNGAVPAYITLLKARGTYYDDLTQVTRKAEDTASQLAYQKRTFSLDGKYITSAGNAQSFCDTALAKYKDPHAEITMSLVNRDSTLWNQILGREISDRITITNTKLGITAHDYFIDYMEHDISMGGLLHTVKYRLADCS